MKLGTTVRVKNDRADGAIVKAGDVGIVVEHPIGHHAAHGNEGMGYLAVKFKKNSGVLGAYGEDFAVFYPDSLEPLWLDEDLYEDVM